jgi:ParB/RepB/Spo0J family partition protein
MIVMVGLERIEDNPFQARMGYDEAKVEELAQDIQGLRGARPETMGLIQVPLGRVMVRLARYDPPERAVDLGRYESLEACFGHLPTAFVQLAAGHSRLRAFRRNADGGNGADWASMPVDVCELDDQAMADIAWSENSKRADLTAIEEGAAIAQAREKFGYSLKEVATRWGLSVSAASNKTRLLLLPERVQVMVREGELGERHARALLPLVQSARNEKAALKMARLAKRREMSAADVEENVGREMRAITRQIAPGMREWDDWAGADVGDCKAVCAGCPHEDAKGGWCTRVDLWQRKSGLWRLRLLALGSEKAGLDCVRTGWVDVLDLAAVQEARERECEHLRVGYSNHRGESAVLVDRDLPGMVYACGDKKVCECRAAAWAARAEDEDPRRAGWAAFVERHTKRGEEIAEELVGEVRARFESAMAGVLDDDLGVFRALLEHTTPGGWRSEERGREAVVEALAGRVTNWGNQRREGLALTYKARVFWQMGIGDEAGIVRGLLQVIRDELEEGRVGYRGEPSKWEVKRARAEARRLLEGLEEPELERELGELVCAVENFSQEKNADGEN